ncbi:MAG: sugar-transfer associated ATP-grasp domain-containing protein [Lentimicrobium sp.]
MKKRIKNAVVYFLARRGARLAWKSMFQQFYASEPQNFKPASKQEERTHTQYWQYFSKQVNPNTYRVCKNISGVGNLQYIPEEIYIADIEATLNHDKTADYIGNKSFYNHWFKKGVFPKDYFHNIDGELLNADLERISQPDLDQLIKEMFFPVIIKPNRDTYGGKNVMMPENPEALNSVMRKMKINYVVQERIRQHEFFQKYNPAGLNTIRVFLYRSVRNNDVHVIGTCMRMGVGGGLDNLSSGGILTFIHPDGKMNGFAVNKFGFKYLRHPDTSLEFNETIPDKEGLYDLSRKIASRIFYARILGLDACYDESGNWRMVEANVVGQHTIKFIQNAGFPFFGDYTDEVVNYCKANHWALKNI